MLTGRHPRHLGPTPTSFICTSTCKTIRKGLPCGRTASIFRPEKSALVSSENVSCATLRNHAVDMSSEGVHSSAIPSLRAC
ncbi:unnamed protein product [Chondrus crispus]|uniref:Uncharacterized protein n=1 Tax=Chondrus crispus TaxID=2769 RepID=R7QIH3_CHOCR|nr:unnamed protein product [Chondrus crispus]CDF37874.1 unnamed protein product [Chondrus crispus]|eukprot:XP_005717745.1 unnamed protein product [Chondrus crispus]